MTSRVLSVAIGLTAVAALTSVAFTAVTVVTTRRADAAFPGYNGLIVFQSDRDGQFEIYVMNAAGGNQTRAVTNTAPSGFDPANGFPSWSPDGSKIVFVRGRDGDGEINVMNVDGSDQTRITNSPGFRLLPRLVARWDEDRVSQCSGR